MQNICVMILLALAISGCRSAPFKVQPLAVKEPKTVEAPNEELVRNLEGVLSEGIKARYKKANSPSFGLIDGYYQLPKTRPFGGATVVRKYSYNTYVDVTMFTDEKQPYAITPISGEDATALAHAVNLLLNNGVKLKEISMADALAIAKAESESAHNQKAFLPGKVLPPDVDYLMSVYPEHSANGPVLIGRVIKKDGTLMAFRVTHGKSNRSMLSKMIISLFEDTINRI